MQSGDSLPQWYVSAAPKNGIDDIIVQIHIGPAFQDVRFADAL